MVVRAVMHRIMRLLSCFFSVMSFAQGFEVQGHRGARALRPENTLPGFLAAIEAGADVLEFDVLVTADDEPIIHHDFFVNLDLCKTLDERSYGSPPLVRSLTLEEIKKLDGGAKVNPIFPEQHPIPGTPIPTLQELFEFLNASSHPHAKKVRLNLEIKRDPRYPEWTMEPMLLAKKIVEMVQQHGFSERIYYSSFDPEVLMALRKVDPKASLGFIFSAESIEIARLISPKAEGMGFLLQIASFLRAEVLSPEHGLLQSREDVISLKKKGFRVIPWTINEPKRWDELIDMGVDGIISDNPAALVQFLQEKQGDSAILQSQTSQDSSVDQY